MSNQLYLNAFNNRISGDYYIGRRTVQYQPEHLVRPTPPTVEAYPQPTLQYVRDPDVESIETLSIADNENDIKPLEYRITGITWYTPRWVNTCNIDNFLSAWVRKIRQTHGKYLKHVVENDRAAAALIEIANHALRAKEKIDSEFVKGIWLVAVLKTTNESFKLNQQPVDCTGFDTFSVFQHLSNHNSFQITSKCNCGTFYHRDFIFEVPDLKQVEILGTPKLVNDAEMPKCTNCNLPRILLDLKPDRNNWLLVFHYNGSRARNNLNPPLSEIPQILRLWNTLFKLEYIAYIQDVPNSPNQSHQVSLQFIRHSWYLYDGARSPKFRRWGGKKYDQLNARLNTLVYFKI
jgi:hypothetical protein